MGKLIRFLWLKERFNHLWTFLGIWLGGTIWTTFMADGMSHVTDFPFFVLNIIAIFIITLRVTATANAFVGKSHILLPADMSQKYLSLMLFSLPLNIGVVLLGYLAALGSGALLVHCIGHSTTDLMGCPMLVCDALQQNPIFTASLLLVCTTAFALGVGLHFPAAYMVLCYSAFFYAKGLEYLNSISVDAEVTANVLSVIALAMLPVSWMVFRYKRYDRVFALFTRNGFNVKH